MGVLLRRALLFWVYVGAPNFMETLKYWRSGSLNRILTTIIIGVLGGLGLAISGIASRG